MSFLSDPQPFHEFAEGALKLHGMEIAATGPVKVFDVAAPARPARLLRDVAPSAWPPPGDACWELVGASRDELAGLYRKLAGHLLFPGLYGYQAARSANEIQFPVPRVIVICANSDDARICLEWARRRNWLVSVRSGGHNGAGFHLCNGITLDLQNLQDVNYDPRRGEVTVGAGVKWGKLGEELDSKKGFVPGGTCGLVAVAGYTMGGGYSFVSRRFGLTCELLVSAQVLLADGSVVTASDRENADLFWALRGGGGGQFGIVLSLTFKTLPQDQFFGFVLTWGVADAPAALRYMEEHHTSNVTDPDRLGYLVAGTTLADAGAPNGVEDRPSVSMLGLFHGTEAEAREHLKGLCAVGRPQWRWFMSGRFHQINRSIFAVLPYTALGLRSASKLEITGYVDDRGRVDWQGLVDVLLRAPNPGNLVAFEPYGGAVVAAPADGTAFPHRGQKLNIKLNSYWKPDWAYNKTRIEAQRWLDEAGATIRPALNGRVYVNYMREDVVDYRSAYWAQHFDRLLKVKTRYDPDQVFRFEQSIQAR